MSNLSYRHFFPYPTFRQGQEHVITRLEAALKRGDNILVTAPNGTGKTIIALSSALSAALMKDKKIIYTCRTHSQSNRVIEELKKINNISNKQIHGVSLRGRNEMCLNQSLLKMKLTPGEAMNYCNELRKVGRCPYYLNYKNVKEELEEEHPELFKEPLDAQSVIAFCSEQKYCPYYLAKELMKYSKVIVLNFRWIFDASIRFRLLAQLELKLDDCILIVDECHNILQVATEVNSFKLTSKILTECLNDIRLFQINKGFEKFREFLKWNLKFLKKREKDLPFGETRFNPKLLLDQLLARSHFKSIEEFHSILEAIKQLNELERKKLNSQENEYFKKDYHAPLIAFWKKYLKIMHKESYFFCLNKSHSHLTSKSYIIMEIISLDPRDATYPVFNHAHGSLNLTGTVNPQVFKVLTGLNYVKERQFHGFDLPSPFDKDSFLALITEGVDTSNESRKPFMYAKMIEKIREVILNTPKNIGIFCASYAILKDLLEQGMREIADEAGKELFEEEKGTSSSQNAFLLKNFKAKSKNPFHGAILLGVCGGRNSEGEDFPGDFMNSVIIVGIPYAYPSARVNAKIKYYDKMFNKKGWPLAYLAPAMQQANQASGRAIRSTSDRGVIVFMDSRFKDEYKWIASWVRSNLELIPDKKGVLADKLNKFWNKSFF